MVAEDKMLMNVDHMMASLRVMSAQVLQNLQLDLSL